MFFLYAIHFSPVTLSTVRPISNSVFIIVASTSPCDVDPVPCKNGGTCFPSSQIEYKCLCPDSFSGKDCTVGKFRLQTPLCFTWIRKAWGRIKGVSSHGKPGKVMEFQFLSLGLEKSRDLTLVFWKFIKVIGMKLYCSVPLLNPTHQHRDIDISSTKIEKD